jgi:hypothetical protein
MAAPFDDMSIDRRIAVGALLEVMPVMRNVATTTAKLLIAHGGDSDAAIAELRGIAAGIDLDGVFDPVTLIVESIREAQRELEAQRGA